MPRTASMVRLSVAAIMLIALPVSTAEGRDKIDPGKLAKRLGALPFKADLDVVVKHVDKQIRQSYADRIARTPDVAEKDRLLAEAGVRVQAIRDTYIQFTGQKTGYNVSVVASEFAHRSGESMLVMPVGRAHDYYFFMKGSLYKVVTTETTRQSFAAYLVNLTELYGKPDMVEYENPETKEAPIKARWSDSDLVLDVASRPDYGAITVRFAKREVLDKVAELRGDEKPPADSAGDGLDPTILDIIKE